MKPVRRWGPHLTCAALAVTASLGYLLAMAWARFGPVADGWQFVLLAIPVVGLALGSNWHWERRTVAALVVLGVVGVTLGIGGNGVFGIEPLRELGPNAYYAFNYDWQTNTLHFGMTNPGVEPLYGARPDRPMTALGVATLALGMYGWVPRRWRLDTDDADPSFDATAGR